jgi:hypothetical protein
VTEEPRTYGRTASGKPITEELVEELATRFEADGDDLIWAVERPKDGGGVYIVALWETAAKAAEDVAERGDPWRVVPIRRRRSSEAVKRRRRELKPNPNCPTCGGTGAILRDFGDGLTDDDYCPDCMIDR